MSMTQTIADLSSLDLEGRLLCHVSIELTHDAPLIVGQTPWRWLRVSNISDGSFKGERLAGNILPGGGDWAEHGQDSKGQSTSHLDVRSLWQTDDGALIYVTYNGRVVIPPDIISEYQDLTRVSRLDPTRYYFRTLPLFQTADKRYTWLNNLVAVGLGKRTATGVLYKIYEIR